MHKLNQYVQEKKAKIKKVRQLEHYLDRGTYEFDNELRVLFNKTENNSPILDSSFDTHNFDQKWSPQLEEGKLLLCCSENSWMIGAS
ncbi:hypothetical protein CIL05_12155 [Virgibacillus profundi]|uniref:Uncharacterized protein n=1 Tax=Virgibacillus profundi TaxID=2024555 RepID=A0A2A2ICQ2_9BACI|nr:hypothetical protein [Virgibacillus profundi]PAV29148.1 hypothetical protein CIL05_12155 [Virgibacillus profundi]PXY53317.1 hypothetical protein CIT14_12280 [Virgibacillus profundi]